MNATRICVILATLVVFCKGNSILYDVEVSEVVNGKEVKTEESEIFIEERFLTPQPPTIELNFDGDEKELDDFVGRASFNLSEIQTSFEKEEDFIPEEHQTFDLGFGAGVVNSPNWGEWTCCRQVVNIQSRERVRQAPKIEMEYKKCRTNYCSAHMCKDNINVCNHFLKSMGKRLCDKTNMMSTFMSHHCPLSCNYCKAPPTVPPRPVWKVSTTKPAPTKLPWWKKPRKTRAFTTTSTTTTTTTTATTQAIGIVSGLVKVKIFSHNLNRPYPSYKYSIKQYEQPKLPWKRIPDGGPELSHFYLYKQKTESYTMPIRFCSTSDRKNRVQKWTITRRRCATGWLERIKLFGSQYRSQSSQLYYVASRGRPHWTARVSSKYPGNGHVSNVFYFYGPKLGRVSQTVGPVRPTAPKKPATKRPAATTRRPKISQKPTATQRPPSGNRPAFPVTKSNQQFSRSIFNQNCLRAHNFFRAVHNVPPLKWSPELAKTSQAWANQLKKIAPERPNELKFPNLRTRNWPHSDSGKGFRNRGDGENIAWDLSNDGSPVEESVHRWYAEVFYYNRATPTRSPAPNKPIGHLTQMLWKDTTHVGCGVSTTKIAYSHYSLISTWTVSHYSPGGNIRYGNSVAMTKKLYDEQVPDIEKGACMTSSGSCNNGNQCMAFGPSRGTCACQGGKPTCQSAGGCIAWCENKSRSYPWREECYGRSKCSCGAKGATCK